jgi:hypothetical protein
VKTVLQSRWLTLLKDFLIFFLWLCKKGRFLPGFGIGSGNTGKVGLGSGIPSKSDLEIMFSDLTHCLAPHLSGTSDGRKYLAKISVIACCKMIRSQKSCIIPVGM